MDAHSRTVLVFEAYVERCLRIPRLLALALVCTLLCTVVAPVTKAQDQPPGQGHVVRGLVWLDMNGNGLQNGVDSGVKQVGVHLINVATQLAIRNGTTSNDGRYVFANVPLGNYLLRFDLPTTDGGASAWEFTLPNVDHPWMESVDSDVDSTGSTAVFVVPAAPSQANDFSTDVVMDAGVIRLPQPGEPGQCGSSASLTLGGTIWRDTDRNGKQGLTAKGFYEPGIAGVEIHLWLSSIEAGGATTLIRGNTGRVTTTDARGDYRFPCLPEGSYYIAIPTLDGFDPTVPFKQAINNDPDDQNVYDVLKTASTHPGSERFLSMPINLTSGTPNPNLTLDGGFSCDVPDPDLDLMLVIDRSTSMQLKPLQTEEQPSVTIDMARSAATHVVNAMELPPQRVGLISFNDEAQVLVALASNAESTRAALANNTLWSDQGDSTDIAKALEAARSQLLQPGHESTRKVVFIWTDGIADPPALEKDARDKATQLRSDGIEVFTFGLAPADSTVGEDLLRDIAFTASSFYTGPLDAMIQYAMEAYRRVSPWPCPDPMLAGDTPILCDTGQRGFIDLGTGAGGNREIQVPGEDPRWKLKGPGIPTERAASIVSNPDAYWTVLDGSQWIGQDAEGSGQVGTFEYVTRFDLPGFVSNSRLFMNMRSDDKILSIQVNGQSVDHYALGAGEQSGEPRTLTVPCCDTFSFGGPYELRVAVQNLGGHTGFDATGAIQYCSAAVGVLPVQLGDTPKIIDIHARGFGTPDSEVTTGHPVFLLADIYVPQSVRLTSCSYSGDGIQQTSLPGALIGSGSGVRSDCGATFELMVGAGPHPLTYGHKSTTLTVRYVDDQTGASGEIQRSGVYKAFFDKSGRDRVGIDEPNWFTYWKDDGAVPGLRNPAISYGGVNGTANGQTDDVSMTIEIFDPASERGMAFWRGRGGSCPGVDIPMAPNPVDGLQRTTVHEMKHLEVERNWESGGIWHTPDPINPDPLIPDYWRDSDDHNDDHPLLNHPNKKDGTHGEKYDDIPDNVEIEAGLDPTTPFSCQDFLKEDRNDNEILAYRSQANAHGVPSRDWANPGSQTKIPLHLSAEPSPPVAQLTRAFEARAHSVSECLAQPSKCEKSSVSFLRTVLLGDGFGASEGRIMTSDQIEPRTGSFAGVYSHEIVDTDGDNLADRLDFLVGINGDGGVYHLWANVTAPDGAPIFTSTEVSVPAGLNTVTLSLDGHRLAALRADGMYSLADVQLSTPDLEGMHPAVVDSANDVYTTPSLLATQFDPTDVQILGGFTNTGVDSNADGALEALKVGVNVKANVAGVYNIAGILDTGHDKVLATSTLTLTAGTHLVGLNFPAGGVFRTRDDGVYHLESVRIQNAAFDVVDELAPNYATASHDHRDFTHGTVDLDVTEATDMASKLNPDAEGNEVLDVALRLNGMDSATGYQIEAQLRDDQFGLITRSGAYVDADVVRQGKVHVTFAGSHIRRAGVDGPYSVSLTLYDGDGNVVDALPIAHVTAPYLASEFVAPPFDILGLAGGQLVDTDNDNLAESLMVAMTVLPHVSGDLVGLAGLDDPSYRTVAIGSVAGTVTAGVTTTLMLTFDGSQIARHGATGPLTVRGVNAWLVAQPGQTVRWDAPFLTAFKPDEFNPNTAVGATPGSNVPPGATPVPNLPGATPTGGVIAPTPTAASPIIP